MTQAAWYVVQSKPKKESVVCAQLSRSESDFECFLPKLRNHLGIQPLFPSYLFVKMRMDVENYRMVHYTRGVLRVIGARESGPIPVPPEAIAVIKERVGSNGLIDQRKMMGIGKEVRVRRGPLKDLIGILEKPAPEEGRVQILFRLLKYPLRAVLKFEDLEAI